MNKMRCQTGVNYDVLELTDAFFPDTNLTKSHENLSLYCIAGCYDAIFSSKRFKNKLFRLFHLPKDKENDAHNFFLDLVSNQPLLRCNDHELCYNQVWLQALCDFIRNQSDLSPAHFAVSIGLEDVYGKDGLLYQWIDSPTKQDQQTPLHLACIENKPSIVSALVKSGADLSKRDNKGNTALHVAIDLGVFNIFETLCLSMEKDHLNIENSASETALHIACRCNQPEMCKILVENGADMFFSTNLSLPISYAAKHMAFKAISALVKACPDTIHFKDTDVTIKLSGKRKKLKFLYQHSVPKAILNKSAEIGLHVMILCGQTDEVIKLITENFPIDKQNSNGDTPLHLSVLHGYTQLVKMLILFGADITIKNNDGKTPKELLDLNDSHNKAEMKEVLDLGCDTFNSTGEKLLSKLKRKPTRKNSGCKVLSLDGGGVRGLIATQILIILEKVCAKKASELFDWIVGTSTGGVIALCLCQGKSASYIQKLYFRLKDSVLTGPKPYNIEKFLINEFGADATMGSIDDGPKVLISAVKADRKPPKLHFFKNYEISEDNVITDEEISDDVCNEDAKKLTEALSSLKTHIWKAASCTCAAPTYFRSVDNFLDGGLLANNPTLDALVEVNLYNKAANNKRNSKRVNFVLSLGTGIPKTKMARSVDVFRPKNPKELMEAAKAGIELTQLIVGAMSESNGHVVERARAWCEMMGSQYFRLNPILEHDLAFDETDDDKLIDLMWKTRLYLHKNINQLDEIIEALCQN